LTHVVVGEHAIGNADERSKEPDGEYGKKGKRGKKSILDEDTVITACGYSCGAIKTIIPTSRLVATFHRRIKSRRRASEGQKTRRGGAGCAGQELSLRWWWMKIEIGR